MVELVAQTSSNDSSVRHELPALLDAIRANCLDAVPPSWPELRAVLDSILPRPLSAHAVLPMAMTRAAGGELTDGVPFATIWTLISMGLRLMDDCADQDDPRAFSVHHGLGRAITYASSLLHLGARLIHALPAELGREAILDEYFTAALQAGMGQDRDLIGGAGTAQEYVRLVEHKTCAAFAFAFASGARMVTRAPAIMAACRQSGYHVGMMLQLLDDLESGWLPGGRSDFAHGRRTFPIWHGLACAHGGAAELRALVFGPEPTAQAARIRALLDAMDVRKTVLWAALEERDRALACLARCPDARGRELLALYMDHLFSDGTALAGL